MMKKHDFKSALTAAVFLLVLFGLGLTHLFLPDQAVSVAERRKLEQVPAFSWQSVKKGDYQTKLEAYLLDQFPARDGFRSLKAAVRFYLYGQKDNNGVYLADGSVQKMEYPLKENQIRYGANKLNAVYDQHLTGMNVYFSIVPDKNYFTAEKNGYPHMDYGRLTAMMTESVEHMTYIDLFDCLRIEDYYITDAHWRQQCLDRVLTRLGEAMDVPVLPLDGYEQNELFPFYGVYCGQSALPVGADTLVYLTNDATQSAKVTGLEFEGEKPVYTVERFEGMDGYDVFLSGAQAILTIECPNAQTDRELIVFRDSFASSLAPLLTGSYSKITLIDLRYIGAQLLGDYVVFDDQDVLFLYSTSVLNSAMLLK